MGSTENTYFELGISAVKSVSGFSVVSSKEWLVRGTGLRLKLELNQAVALWVWSRNDDMFLDLVKTE
jgi:hypothetical protein